MKYKMSMLIGMLATVALMAVVAIAVPSHHKSTGTINAVSAAAVVAPQTSVTTVTAVTSSAPVVAPTLPPAQPKAAVSAVTTVPDQTIITHDASGYCYTVNIEDAPSGAVNEPNCVSDPKPFYYREALGYCAITGRGEAVQDALVYDATCEPTK